jgi:hypothetical protein
MILNEIDVQVKTKDNEMAVAVSFFEFIKALNGASK